MSLGYAKAAQGLFWLRQVYLFQGNKATEYLGNRSPIAGY